MAINKKIDVNKLNKVSGGKGLGVYFNYTNKDNSYIKIKCDKCGKIQKIYPLKNSDYISSCESCGAELTSLNLASELLETIDLL